MIYSVIFRGDCGRSAYPNKYAWYDLLASRVSIINYVGQDPCDPDKILTISQSFPEQLFKSSQCRWSMTGVMVVYENVGPNLLLVKTEDVVRPSFKPFAPVDNFLIPTFSNCFDFPAVAEQADVTEIGSDRIE